MDETKKRYDYLDILKLYAIVAVISIHIPLFDYNLSNDNISDYIQFAVKVLTQTVPLFFAINGFLLLGKHELDIKKHTKKILKLALIFIVWSLSLILINLIYDKTVFDRSVVIDLFLNTKSGSLYTGELWFLQALFCIYLIYPLLWSVYKNEIKIFKYLFFVLLVINVVTNILDITSILLTNQIRVNQINDFIGLINRFNIFNGISWFVMYFMLGGIIKLYIEDIKNNKCLILICSVSIYVISLFISYIVSSRDNYSCELFDSNSSILSIAIIIFGFVVSLGYKKESKLSYILSDIGSNTLGIYLSHTFFLRLARLFFNQEYIVLRLLTTILTLLFSYLFTKLMKRIPFVKELFKI